MPTMVKVAHHKRSTSDVILFCHYCKYVDGPIIGSEYVHLEHTRNVSESQIQQRGS